MDKLVTEQNLELATSGRSNDVVRLQNLELTLSSRAGDVDILRGVTWSVEQGRSVAVVGPSGSGKTSLLMIIAGLERATRGVVQMRDMILRRLAKTIWRKCAGTALASCSNPFILCQR